MYCPETIKQMNAESSLRSPAEVNTCLAAIKEALRQVTQVDAQIEVARQLKATRPDLAKQLNLAEEFYVAERERLLDLEDLVSALSRFYEGLASLLEQYERERLTLECRQLLVENGGFDSPDIVIIREEGRFMLPQLTQRCEKVVVTLQEIREVLDEYSSTLSDVRLHGLKQRESSSRKQRCTRQFSGNRTSLY